MIKFFLNTLYTKLNVKYFFFLTFFLIVTSCYKSKSDLQGLWEFHSYLSKDGEKKYMKSINNKYFWSIDEDLFLKSIEFIEGDSIYYKKILLSKNENNIYFGLNSMEKVTYFLEKDTLYLYPLGEYLPEELNTPYTEELIFVKIHK